MKYNTLSQKEQAKRHAYPQHHADAQGRYESNLTRPSWCLRLDSSSDVPVHIFAFPNGAGDPPLLSYFSPQLYGILGLRLGNGHWSAILCFQLVQPGAANADYAFLLLSLFYPISCLRRQGPLLFGWQQSVKPQKNKNKIEKREYYFFEAIMSNYGLCELSLKGEYFALELILRQQTVLPFAIDPRLASFLFIIIIFLILILINYLSLLILSYPSIYFSRPSL